ncbi:MFS general substrate transporter [Annulohypoxylon maeteangense]|uniref:MFS general substrate transporter n=1 Tax=Annulohypoxylon maeteangense TaxID=1927788 RepID=UPI00200816D9|nr:MFS general substrate transporter [Annulohypoxylon maeteangense]KAI0888053.1 MFS general substrate transporter [Annulohypoxylon maeteangense]
MIEKVQLSLKWFYHEFGLAAIHETGLNAYLIILARTCRMFAYGTNALILGIFFSALGISDHQIGLFMTLTLMGDVILGTYITLVADRIGKRRVMIGGSLLMILSGLIFALFENFWILLLAAVIGVISITGGDFGPFRSIEESMISQLTTPSTRADVLSWHVTIPLFGSSLGSELSGRVLRFLQDKDGWSEVDAYHALFWIYAIMGVVNLGLVLLLSDACELSQTKRSYTQVPQDDNGQNTDRRTESPAASPDVTPTPKKSQNRIIRSLKWFSNRLALISPATRSVMYKLWFLLAVDSLADGMVPYSLTNYYMNEKFHPQKSTLGDITSFSYFLGAISASFAGPLARKIGLINTMVFTHTPSSAAVLLFPLPPYLWLTAGLLLVRAGLNNMDQAPRAAFIAAVVKPEERTAVMGITATVRTLAAMTGPTVTGLLAASDRFWIAFVAAGCSRLAYDFGLYALFVNMRLHEHENKSADLPNGHGARRIPDEEMELESLADTIDTVDTTDSTDSGSEDLDPGKSEPSVVRLEIPDENQRIRSRSPRRERYGES